MAVSWMQVLIEAYTTHVVVGYAQLQLWRGLLPAVHCQSVGPLPKQDGYSLILQLCKGVCERSIDLDDCVGAFMQHAKVLAETGFATAHVLFICFHSTSTCALCGLLAGGTHCGFDFKLSAS